MLLGLLGHKIECRSYTKSLSSYVVNEFSLNVEQGMRSTHSSIYLLISFWTPSTHPFLYFKVGRVTLPVYWIKLGWEVIETSLMIFHCRETFSKEPLYGAKHSLA